MAFLSQRSEQTYTFLRDTKKIIPIKQQQKWCDTLQILPNNIDRNKIHENNYLATNEKKMRSFQFRLNMRSIVTNVHLNGFRIADKNHCVFCSENPTIIHLFCKGKFVDNFWQDFSAWLSTNYVTILTWKTGINYLEIFQLVTNYFYIHVF